ncbi:transglutaminaseTgpA domain-containing protein [Thermodesulfovibrio sp. 3907-1M]|uniref:transglutaminase family protein n=1 Tax=Thermodesulfovibrio autotrophicus TaxID=3118333 RepID=UPI00338E6772
MLLRFITQSKTENIIFVLSILIALIPFTAIFSYISNYVNFIFLLIILASVFLHIKKIFLPIWLLNFISIGLIIMPFLSFSLEDILLPSIEALILILSIRFLSKKSSREYFQIYLLSLLLLGSSSLFNISWIFLIRVLGMLVFTIFAILLLTYMKEVKEDFINFEKIINLFKVAIFICVISIPLSALFFVILPRTPVPLMDIGFSKTKTGFSSTVNLGSVRDIEEDKTIIMRVTMEKLSQELYWRVITFDSFDGKRWRKRVSDKDSANIYGEKINYTVTLEPLTEQYLPVLDYPLKIYIQDISQEYPGVYRMKFSPEKTIKYSATSFVNYHLKEASVSSAYLEIPKIVSEKIINLTQKITSHASNKREIAESILKYLTNYQYALKDLPTGDNPVEDFLFNKKKGNCEYFATAMALMLRIKNIPSRVVGGFKGGTYNEFGGYYIVRASDAHLWVEAWIDGQWHRFDPSGKIYRTHESVIFNLIDYLWNSIVLDYDIKAQFKLAKSLKTPEIKFTREIFLILMSLGILYGFLKIYQYFNKKRDLLNRFFIIMKKQGFERKKYEGLEEFVSKIENSEVKLKAEKFVKEYEKIYFKDREISKEEHKKLKALLEQLNETHDN